MKKYLGLFMALIVLTSMSFAFAQTGSTNQPEQRKEDNKGKMEDRRDGKGAPVALTTEQITCVKTSITKREDTLSAAYTTNSTAINAAYMARKVALLAAWDKTVPAERRVAVRAADKAFKDSTKTARKAWNESRRGSWKTFEIDRKACGVSGNSADTGSSESDASL